MVTNFTALCFSNSRTRSVLFVNKELRRAAQFLPSVAFGSIPSDLIHFSLFLSSLSFVWYISSKSCSKYEKYRNLNNSSLKNIFTFLPCKHSDLILLNLYFKTTLNCSVITTTNLTETVACCNIHKYSLEWKKCATTKRTKQEPEVFLFGNG